MKIKIIASRIRSGHRQRRREQQVFKSWGMFQETVDEKYEEYKGGSWMFDSSTTYSMNGSDDLISGNMLFAARVTLGAEMSYRALLQYTNIEKLGG